MKASAIKDKIKQATDNELWTWNTQARGRLLVHIKDMTYWATDNLLWPWKCYMYVSGTEKG